jgi:hypothetical protein
LSWSWGWNCAIVRGQDAQLWIYEGRDGASRELGEVWFNIICFPAIWAVVPPDSRHGRFTGVADSNTPPGAPQRLQAHGSQIHSCPWTGSFVAISCCQWPFDGPSVSREGPGVSNGCMSLASGYICLTNRSMSLTKSCTRDADSRQFRVASKKLTRPLMHPHFESRGSFATGRCGETPQRHRVRQSHEPRTRFESGLLAGWTTWPCTS